MTKITSYRIPIIDDQDHSFAAKTKEFFSGYFYYGGTRYEQINIGRNKNFRRFQEKEVNHYVSTALKVATLLTLIAPLIGAVFLLCNIIDRKWHNYRLFTNEKVPEPTLHTSKPQPKAIGPNLDFQDFFQQRHAANPRFGTLSNTDWKSLVAEYRSYRNDKDIFITQMLLLKQSLLKWHQERLEGPLAISPESFVEDEVRELLTEPLDAVLTEPRQKLLAQETQECFIKSRLRHLLKQPTCDAKAIFASHYTQYPREGVLQAFIEHATASQIEEIAQGQAFYKALCTSSPTIPNREMKLQAAFRQFWQHAKDKVRHDGYNMQIDFWHYLQYYIRLEDLPAILSSIPDTLPESQCREIADKVLKFWTLGKKIDRFEETKATLEKIVRNCPKLKVI